MKNFIGKVYEAFGIESGRTKNIANHVILAFLYKGGSIIANLMLIPITINYLSTENYGVWITLTSFISWFSFFDIGVGNGLRNKFSKAKLEGDITLARAYVSSAYYFLSYVCVGLVLVFLFINYFIDWSIVFNTKSILQKDIGILMPIVFTFFCIQLVVKLITTIYAADQNHSMPGKVNFLTQICSLIIIWTLTVMAKSSLLIFGTIFSVVPVVLLIFLNVVAFKKEYREFRPTYKLFKKIYLKEIFGLGISFFFIQMAWIIISTTDSFLIAQLFSPKDVVPFSIAIKFFSVMLIIFTTIVTPYWSSFTESYVNGDYIWIKRSMRNLIKFATLFCLLSFVLLFFSQFIYKIWLGDKIVIPLKLNFLVCLYTCLLIYLTPLNYFINGIGKIRIQLYQTLFFAIVNIPISIFFAKNLNLGVEGVVLGTVVCTVPGIILSGIQNYKIVNQKAFGFWNR